MKWIALLLLTFVGVGCATRAVIADLESDKVIIQVSGGRDMGVVNREAMKACSIHSRVAHGPLSMRCLDEYCIVAQYLYACK